MLGDILTHLSRFIILILIQVLLLNNVEMFNGMAIPFLYILFLLALPFELPRWAELLIGFITGLTIDIFNNTAGLHASACVVLAFVRPLLLKALAPREGYDFGTQPKIRDMGFLWYLYYAGILIFIHHAWLLYVEVFSFGDFFITLSRVILSSIFSLIIIIISQYLAFGPSRG